MTNSIKKISELTIKEKMVELEINKKFLRQALNQLGRAREEKTALKVELTALNKTKTIMKDVIGILEEAKKKTEALDRMKTEFISVASHQLRTPLTGIKWVVERFLRKEKVTKKGKEYLKDIYIATQRLSNLVELLLNVSRIEGEKVNISLVQLEVVGFIENYLDECTALCDKKNISIIFKKHPKMLKIVTDSSALRNIVQSIVSNAIEYNIEGGIVEVSLEKKGLYFLFVVRDTGIGMPKKEQPTIFDKFTRGSNAQLIKTDGTGLGLYLTRQTVNLLGGKIWFKSKINKGTIFHVELPLKSRSKKDKI